VPSGDDGVCSESGAGGVFVVSRIGGVGKGTFILDRRQSARAAVAPASGGLTDSTEISNSALTSAMIRSLRRATPTTSALNSGGNLSAMASMLPWDFVPQQECKTRLTVGFQPRNESPGSGAFTPCPQLSCGLRLDTQAIWLFKWRLR
jgi:hypothetical protein